LFSFLKVVKKFEDEDFCILD